MRSVVLFFVFWISASLAWAENSDLQRLDTGDQSRAWEAVGRLDIGGQGICTGALIAPKLVLTAAHCLYDKTTGQLIDPTTIEFLAGWRNGRASAYRGVLRALTHPGYEQKSEVVPDSVRNDVALLELDHAIRNTRIYPFRTAKRPQKGERVGVVSYGRERLDAPSYEESCNVIARQQGALIMSCDVSFGSSGAPIFSFENGEPRVVSVVSAMAEVEGRKVSLGTELQRPLSDLLLEMGVTLDHVDAEGGVFSNTGRRASGAKFAKP